MFFNENCENKFPILRTFGKSNENGIEIIDHISLFNSIPSVTLCKKFYINSLKNDKKGIKSAILCSTARGFYTCYLNGQRVGTQFYAPGFTEYAMHIDWQQEDLTKYLKEGENIFVAVVGKGYYSGYCGYSGAEIYGRENSFLGVISLEWNNGEREDFSTNESWEKEYKFELRKQTYPPVVEVRRLQPNGMIEFPKGHLDVSEFTGYSSCQTRL